MPKKKTNCCENCDPNVHPMHRVTTLSKALAFILFVTLPLLAFALGSNYQKTISQAACPVLGAYYQE